MEESFKLPPVELCCSYGYGERSFCQCVKYSDENKFVLVRRVIVDMMIPERTQHKKVFIDINAGNSWLRESRMIKLVESRPDVRMQNFLPYRFKASLVVATNYVLVFRPTIAPAGGELEFWTGSESA